MKYALRMNLHYLISTLFSNLCEKTLEEGRGRLRDDDSSHRVNWNIGTIRQKVWKLPILRGLNHRLILGPFLTSMMELLC